MFLTATHPKFKCGVCKQIDSELAILADSYAKAPKNEDDNKVFFLRLDYESSQRVFQNYQVNSVPMLFYVAPQHGAEKAGSEYQISSRDRYMVPPSPDAESLASFLGDRANISVKIERSMIGAYITLIIVFGVLAALVQPVINSLPFLLRIVQWKPLWIAVSCGVYTCAISGLIYDIIRSPQMYVSSNITLVLLLYTFYKRIYASCMTVLCFLLFLLIYSLFIILYINNKIINILYCPLLYIRYHANPQTGQIQFFYPQSGSQFVVEGFVIGFLNLACAGSLAMILMFAPYFKDEQHRTMGIVGGVVVFVMCFRMVRSLYIMKNMWYGRAF